MGVDWAAIIASKLALTGLTEHPLLRTERPPSPGCTRWCHCPPLDCPRRCIPIRFVETDQRSDDQVLVHGPLGIQVQLTGIQVQGVVFTHGVVIEVQRTEGQVLQRRGGQADMMNARVAVEGSGIVTRDFALEPGAITRALPGEQRIPLLRIAGVAVRQLGCPGQIGKGVAGLGVPGVLRAGVLVLPGVFKCQAGVLDARVAFPRML